MYKTPGPASRPRPFLWEKRDEMNIRHATGQDMDALCALYAAGRRFMAAHGNTAQWRGGYPGRALLEEDLRRGQLYVCEQGGAVCAAFVFFVGEEPSYAHIDGAWLCGGPYGVVHRLCSPGRAKGAATACLQFCMQRCESLRIDTHQNNLPMRSLLHKLGFAPCGVIRLANGSPRLAFQRRCGAPFACPAPGVL